MFRTHNTDCVQESYLFGKQCKTAFDKLLATTHGFFGMPHAKAIVVARPPELRLKPNCHIYYINSARQPVTLR